MVGGVVTGMANRIMAWKLWAGGKSLFGDLFAIPNLCHDILKVTSDSLLLFPQTDTLIQRFQIILRNIL